MTSGLSPNCHLCKKEMGFDFSNNVWCKNTDCLLYDQLYDHQTYDGNQLLIRRVEYVRKLMYDEFINRGNI